MEANKITQKLRTPYNRLATKLARPVPQKQPKPVPAKKTGGCGCGGRK